MPNTTVRTVSLGSEYFEFITTKTGWTKERYRIMDTGNLNDIPVYTASLNPVAHVSAQTTLPITASKQNPIISFAANGDGSAGTNFVYHTCPFYVSNDRTCIRVSTVAIDPYFIYYRLRDIKKIYGFDFHYKATPANVSLITVDIPVDSDGEFDIDTQRQIVRRVTNQQQTKDIISSQIQNISTAIVTIDIHEPVVEISLGNPEFFATSIGKRELIKDSEKSGVPIYSANVRKPFGYVKRSLDTDFSRPSLIWGIDWIFDWNLIPANQPFIPTDHCGVLKILHPDILPLYLYYALWSTRERYGFDRTFRASLGNVRALTVIIPTKNGTFDQSRQAEIADRYHKIGRARSAVLESLTRITGAIVNYA